MQKFKSGVIFFIAVFLAINSLFGQKTYTGSVIEFETNLQLVGASIYWEGTNIGTKSDKEGSFIIKEFDKSLSLIISYIGFEKQIIKPEDLFKRVKLQIKLKKTSYNADEVIVNALRATDNSAMAFTNIGKSEISKLNVGQDLPLLLNFTPSLVTTSDAGAGIGYTGLRIRGTDATRINVTVNGIPINDSESQGVYWVNVPDLASSVNSIQIQRGVGTSTNGAGAFGGSINIQSNEFIKEPYAEINSSAGSFNSFKNNIRLGSGLIGGNFTIDGRLSRITSDGYVDRAFSKLNSYYVSGAYFGKNSFARLITFGGNEKTYQSWNGVSEAMLDTARTFNSFTYPNQTDNYSQTHYQLLTTQMISSKLSVNANFHYTKGKGYYEEFRGADKLSDYGIFKVYNNIESEIVRQKWLDNDFYGTTFSFDYQSFKRISASFGGALNRYDGDHFGKFLRIEKFPEFNGSRWYFSNSVKTDFNIYGKANYYYNKKLNIYADLQLRKVNLIMEGTASKVQKIDQIHNYTFFNPKLGLTYSFTSDISAYASYAVGQKEPNRTDFTDTQSIAAFIPKPEKLNDFEAGLKLTANKLVLNANGYFMKYKNQLVITGAINETGEPIRINLPKSYRAGIEIDATYNFSKKVVWNVNTTLSSNKIEKFIELIPDYEGNYKENELNQTDIAFSPNIILGSQLTLKPTKSLEIGLLTKYVGKQYLDNTSFEKKKLNPYLTNDIRAKYSLSLAKLPTINLGLFVYNILNEKYESNGYTYSYLFENQVFIENFYYPQAGRNFMLSANIKF